MSSFSTYKDTIISYLTGQINSGAYMPGARLPTVRSLAEKFQTSIIPAIEAYEDLEHRGIIYKHVGKGTFVSLNAAVKHRNKITVIIPVYPRCDAGIEEGLRSVIKLYSVKKSIHTDIVEVAVQENFFEKLNNSGAADIVIASWDTVTQLMNRSLLKKLHCGSSHEHIWKSIRPQLTELFMHHSSGYYIPVNIGADIFLTQAGGTADFLHGLHSWKNLFSSFLLRGGSKEKSHPLLGFAPVWPNLQALIYNLGGKIISRCGRRCLLNRKNSILALKTAAELIRSGIIPRTIHLQNDPQFGIIPVYDQLFLKNKTIIHYQNTYWLNDYYQVNSKFKPEIFPMHCGPDSAIRISPLCAGIHAKSPHADLAQQFIDFLITPEAQIILCKNSGGFPAICGLHGDPCTGRAHPEGWALAEEALSTSRLFYSIERSDISEIIINGFNEILNDIQNIEGIINTMTKKLNSILAQNKLKYQKISKKRQIKNGDRKNTQTLSESVGV